MILLTKQFVSSSPRYASALEAYETEFVRSRRFIPIIETLLPKHRWNRAGQKILRQIPAEL